MRKNDSTAKSYWPMQKDDFTRLILNIYPVNAEILQLSEWHQKNLRKNFFQPYDKDKFL